MYKVIIDRLVNQLTSPNRKKPKRLALLNVLLEPLKSIFDITFALDTEAKERAKIVPQQIVVQHYLNEIAGGEVTLIENQNFVDNIARDRSFYCILPAGFPDSNLYLLQYFVSTINPAGFMTGLQLFNPAFRIKSVNVVQVSGTLTATVNAYNPKGLALEYSINDTTYQSSNVFAGLTATSIFYVRQVGHTDTVLSAYNVNSVNINFNIYDVVIVKTSTIKATVQVYNPTSAVLEYSIDDVNYQLSNVFTGLVSTNVFYVRLVSNPSNKKTFEKIDSVVTDDFYTPSATNKLKTLEPQVYPNLDFGHFGTVNTRTYNDAGYERTIWGIWWDMYYEPFLNAGVKPWEVGVAGSTYVDDTKDLIDYLKHDQQDANYLTFTSAIPYQYRSHNEYGVGPGVEPWFTGSAETLYNFGREIAQSNKYGGGDNSEGKTKRSIVVADVENGLENGSLKHRAFMLGALSRTKGYFSSLYNGVFLTLGYIEDPSTKAKFYWYYPDSSGNYSSSANINVDWKIDTLTSVEAKGIFNVKLVDYPTALPCNEQSFYFEEFALQGSNYPLNASGDYIAVNKFGSSKTVRNPLAVLGTTVEWQAWYCRYKLNNHRNMFMAKFVADRGPLGKNPFSQSATGGFIPDSLEEHTNQECGRKYAFIFLLNLFSNGVDPWVWNRTIHENTAGMDTYTAIPAVLEMLEGIGAIQVHRELIPLFWETEYSLDNGITWKKTYAIDWDTSTTDVLSVRISKSVNKVLLIALRPEGFEPTSFIARTPIGSVMKYFHVGANDWQTTDYAYATTALADLPNLAKHYYCQLFTF